MARQPDQGGCQRQDEAWKSSTNGKILDVLDFQSSSAGIGGASSASLNGLLFEANEIDFASLTAGSCVLDCYYAPYNTNLGLSLIHISEPTRPY